MGHRGSKIGFSGTNLDGFFMKITFSMSVCVRKVTFGRSLKIFEKKNENFKNISDKMIFLKS